MAKYEDPSVSLKANSSWQQALYQPKVTQIFTEHASYTHKNQKRKKNKQGVKGNTAL